MSKRGQRCAEPTQQTERIIAKQENISYGLSILRIVWIRSTEVDNENPQRWNIKI